MLNFVGFGVVCAFGLIISDVTAETIEDMKEEYMKIILECIAKHPVNVSELESLRKQKLPDGDKVKCFLACSYQKTGMMNEKGDLSIENIRQIAQKYMSNNPEIMRKSEEFLEACKSVNDEPVSDGDKGCERAALLYNCSIKNAPDLQFV